MADAITQDEFDAANRRALVAAAQGPRAISARYSRGRVVLDLDNGCSFAFPAARAEGLADARAADLASVEITPSGLGLHWPRLDVDLSVPALLRGMLGSRQWMAKIGQVGGRSKSDAKAAAARANGRKGGRPRKREDAA
ncbi:MAG: DUF2442 domain-containing protein [Burkholderiaceae bacterium]|nr:DUF2442 domain-containing protein [Burkholderiaceae bacterium]